MAKQSTLDKFFSRKYWLKRNATNGKEQVSDNLQKRNALYLKQLRNRATRAEIIFGDFLWDNKIYFIFQKGFFKPFHRIADFYIPGKNLIIEIDGSSHRFTKAKDKRKDDSFSQERYFETLRLTNQEVYDGSFKEKIMERLGRTYQYLSPHNLINYVTIVL